MQDPQGAQPYPETDESPSLQAAECLRQHPATGLRLPAPTPGAALQLRSGRSDSSSRREQDQGTASDRQFSTDSTTDAPTELVLEGRMERDDPNGVGWTLRDDSCPLEGAVSFDRTTGEVAWRPTCKNARCRRCSRQVSAQTFALARRAVDQVDHVRFITLTQAPQGWQETRAAMRDWNRSLRDAGKRNETLWVVEEGSETAMKHVHAVQWGDFIPKGLLDDSWPYGTNEIQAATAATDYLAKGVVRYVAKGLDQGGEALEAHMNLNGGRAAHWSREFFGGMGRNAYRQANPLPGIYFVQVAR